MEKKFVIGDSLSKGWSIFKANVGFFVLLLVVAWLVFFALWIVGGMVQGSALLSFVMGLVNWAVQILIGIGFIKIALKFVDGGKGEIADLFSGKSSFVSYLIASILYGIMVMVGSILLIIPGIIVAIIFMFYGYLIVDKRMAPIDALKKSMEITKGEGVHLFLFVLAAILVNILGALCLFVGLIVSVPVTLIANADIYRKLSV